MMNIKDIFERVRLRSGQYIVNKGKIEINIDAFRLLVEDSLAVYNRHSPFDVLLNREIYYPRQYDFSNKAATFLDPTGTAGVPEPVVGRIPDWISSANPMRYGGGSIGGVFLKGGELNGESELIDPVLSPWRYDRPLLTVSHSARYEIRAVYDHLVTELVAEEEPDKEIQYIIKTISTKDQALFDYVRALFLQGIGRSRRAFTMSDLPITMDGDQLVSDGMELEEKALTSMQNFQKFYLTHGG